MKEAARNDKMKPRDAETSCRQVLLLTAAHNKYTSLISIFLIYSRRGMAEAAVSFHPPSS